MKLFIFGSTGDLVRRKVLPALQELNKPLEIYALGRKPYSTEQYMEHIKESNLNPKFSKQIKYLKFDFKDNLAPYLDKKETNLFYVSFPPELLSSVLEYIGNIKKLGYPVRVLIEKPFGTDLESAQKLTSIIIKYDLDASLSDHYLFKKNILSMKIKPFSKMKIVVLEKLGLENRITYYDSTGALKDMIQSHFMNIVFKFFDDFSDFKIIKYERKQYEGYTNELGKTSDTETFVHLVIEAKGKTFEFVTGKGFASKISYIEIDGKKTDIDSYENPYVEMFKRFIDSSNKDFPDIKHAFMSWKIVDTISKVKPRVGYYNKGAIFQQSWLF